MTWRYLTAVLLAALVLGPAVCRADETSAQPAAAEAAAGPIEYVPLDAPDGMSQAVIVEGRPLVHTRQLLPLDAAGNLVGDGSVDEQIEQVLDNLDAVLKDAGSELEMLVRLHVYALNPSTIVRVRELLSKRLPPAVRPAITSVLTPLPRRGAVVAVDAVAAGTRGPDYVWLHRSDAVAGDAYCADAAVMPALPWGGVAYLSGVPEDGGLTESAVDRAMTKLMTLLGQLELGPQHVVQVKVFLRPVTTADAVLRELRKFFPEQAIPPVVFVEWLASVRIEIEMIAHLPPSREEHKAVEYFTPPEVRPSHIFSRAALVRTDRQIYISGQYAREPSRGELQALHVFDQLQEILDQTGSDMRHLVKATYYTADHDASRWVDRTRPNVFAPDRPPAASKAMVHAVGMEGRTMTIDMIAVEREN